MTGPRAQSQSNGDGPPAGVILPTLTVTEDPALDAADGTAHQSADEREVKTADSPEVEAGDAARVIYFSDAVVAIAITLLALALPLPHSTGLTSNRQMLHLLISYWDEYLAFVISFAAIGLHWTSHRRITRYVIRVNHQFGQLTLLWLLMMVLTPFAARLLAGSGGFGIRFTLYALIQIIATTCLLLMSREVTRADLLRSDTPVAARHPDHVVSITFIVLFTVSIPVAFFTTWAFALWAAVPLVIRVIRLHQTGRLQAASRWLSQRVLRGNRD